MRRCGTTTLATSIGHWGLLPGIPNASLAAFEPVNPVPIIAVLAVGFLQVAFGQEAMKQELDSGLAMYSARVSQEDLHNLEPTTTTLASWDAFDRNASSELLARLRRAGAQEVGRAIFLGEDILVGNLVLPVHGSPDEWATQSANVLNFLVEADPYKRALPEVIMEEDAAQFGWALQATSKEDEVEQELHFIQTVAQIPILGAEASVTIDKASQSATDIYLSLIREDEVDRIPGLVDSLTDPQRQRAALQAVANSAGASPDRMDWVAKPFMLRTSDGVRPIFVVNPRAATSSDSPPPTIVDAVTLETFVPGAKSSFARPMQEDQSSCESMPFRNISGYELAEHDLVIGFETLLCAPAETGTDPECIFGLQKEYPGNYRVRVVVKDGFRDENNQLCGRHVSPFDQSLTKTRIYYDALETLFEYAKYLYEELGWCGLDGGCRTIQALIFDEGEYASAKFDHRTNSLFFGDDPDPARRHTALNPSIIGHELIHGIIRARSQPRVLLDACMNLPGEQFGALEESLGDITGTLLHSAVFANIDPDSLNSHGGVIRWGFNEFGEVHYRDFRFPLKSPAGATDIPQPNRFPPSDDYRDLSSTQLWQRWENDGGPQPEHFDDRLGLTCQSASLVPYINSGIPNKLGYLLMTARDSGIDSLKNLARSISPSDTDWHAKLLRIYYTFASEAFRCKRLDNCHNFCSFRSSYQHFAFEVLQRNDAGRAISEVFDLVGIPDGGACE